MNESASNSIRDTSLVKDTDADNVSAEQEASTEMRLRTLELLAAMRGCSCTFHTHDSA